MDFSRKRISFLSWMAWVVCTAGIAAAQVELPLGGYVRAGRCMPVKIDGSIRQIQGDGVIATHIADGLTGIVPVLVLSDSPGVIRAGSTELPLRPLLSDQRLVGVVGSDSSIPAMLFAGSTIITVPLDGSRPLAGPVIAWETLDAVILDTAPANVDELLAAGITVGIRSVTKPDERWPWERVGEVWVVRPGLAGPTGAIGGEHAYLPTQAWAPGRPDGLRRQIVLAAVLVLLVLMSAMLIRGNRAIIGMLVIAILCGGAIELWRRRLPAIASAGGDILVRSDRVTQRDTWTYLAAGTSGGEGSIQLARPIVASMGHAALVGLQLLCDKDDALTWRYRLPPHARLAMLHRTITSPIKPPVTTMPVLSPLFELARQAYLSPGSRISGESPAEGWPTVVITHE